MKIASKVKDYCLEAIENLLENKEKVYGGSLSGRRFYFVDKRFYDLYEDRLKQFIGEDFCLLIEAKEQNKAYLKLSDYFTALIEAGFTRNDTLVTFGGGILQDISGFIASTLYRGIKWIFFPTTLLAQADSCIGSKTSINFGDSKNLIGTFYPPDYIYVDKNFCQTLASEEFHSGLGEIIKFHLLSNEERYAKLSEYLSAENLREGKLFEDIILSTLEIKKSYFEEDEFDTGRRNLLNYGHCFGHALESASQFAVCHGEAVTVGMGFANLLALKRGILTKQKYDEYEEIFQQYYPRFALADIAVDNLIHYLKRDKKRVTKDLTMIMLADVGDAGKYDDVKESEIQDVYKDFLNIYPSCEGALK